MPPFAPQGKRPTILALGGIPSPGNLVSTSAVKSVREALRVRQSLLWVQGQAGCGKTTALGWALCEPGDFAAIQRVPCFPQLRLEEVLYYVKDLLFQLGIDDLAIALDQRSPLRDKLEVLLRVIAEHPIALWLDDFHDLAAGNGENRDTVLKEFLHGYASCPSVTKGLLVVTSAESPPLEDMSDPVVLPSLNSEDREALWKWLSESGSPRQGPVDLSEIPRGLVSQPLAMELTHRLLAQGRAETREQLLTIDTEHAVEELCAVAIDLLTPSARDLLEILTSYQRPVSRQAVRALTASGGQEVVLGTPDSDHRLLELEKLGLVHCNHEGKGSPAAVTLHPLIHQVVEDSSRQQNAERWKDLLTTAANYHLALCGRGGGFWSLHRARWLLFKAESYDNAYEIQKCYLKDLLQLGYMDLACQILQDTVSTTSGQKRAVALGNLAMIHKNRSDYEHALEFYGQVRGEFQALGDTANLARVLHQIGNIHYLKGDLREALACYNQSLDLSTDIGASMIANATRIQVANVLYQIGHRDEALKNYEQAVEELQATENRNMIAAVHLQMGQIHLQAKRYVEAEAQLADAAREAASANDRRSLLKVLKTQALVERERREYDQAAKTYEDAVQVASELGDPLEAAACQILWGDLERDRVQLGRSLAYYESARKTLTHQAGRVRFRRKETNEVKKMVEERLRDLAATMGPEAFQRALTGSGGKC